MSEEKPLLGGHLQSASNHECSERTPYDSPSTEVDPAMAVASAASTSMFAFISVFAAKVRAMPCAKLCLVMFLIVLLTVGNAMQLIGINFWLNQFADGSVSGSFTILMMSGTIFSVVFTIWLFVYTALKRPNIDFMKQRRGWVLLFGVGLNDTLNSFMAIYAANYTPEVLQALFQTLLPVYACVMSKYFLSDPRNYCNRWIVVSFILITAGVVVAAVPNFTGGDNNSDNSGSAIGWSVVFFLSVPFTALQFVWQSKYMVEYTIEPPMVLPEDEVEGGGGAAAAETAALGRGVKYATQSRFRLIQQQLEEEEAESDADNRHHRHATDDELTIEERIAKATTAARDNDKNDSAVAVAVATGENNDGTNASTSTSLLRNDNNNKGTSRQAYILQKNASSHLAERVQSSKRSSSCSSSSSSSDGDVDRENKKKNGAASSTELERTRGEDTIVKLTMLFGDVGIQLFLSLLLLPADALPWWGGAPGSMSLAWKHFADGTKDLFTQKENFFYCAVYSGGYIMQYISAAYLNHYSATLSTMVSQLSSPITAIVLIIVPSWNVTPGDGAWYWSAIAVLLLSLGTIIYSAWEEMSSQELALVLQQAERERRQQAVAAAREKGERGEERVEREK